ncbi:MAG: ATP-binding protein [bacterium]|nr:ATP-binding protein [bacterium]
MQEIQTTTLLVIASLNALLGIFVVLGKKNSSSRIFSIFALLLSLWAFGLALFLNATTTEASYFYANSYYVIGLSFVCFFLIFARVFPENRQFNRRDTVLVVVPIFALVSLFILNPQLFLSQIIIEGSSKAIVMDRLNYSFFVFVLIIYLGVAYKELLQKYRTADDITLRKQFNFVLCGTSIAWFFGIIFNIALPWANNYKYIWLGPVFTIIMIASIAYAVTKHHLFETKVIATEALTFMLWLFLLVRATHYTNKTDIAINVGLLLVSILIGILLIRSVIKEVKIREKVEKLAEELSNANSQLIEMNRQKTEFLSIASHQFRTPLTAIKGYSSMLLEGSFGKMSEKVRGAVDTVYQSSEHLVSVINDFLDVSRIELGRMKYTFEVTNFLDVVKEILGAQKPSMDASGLEFKILLDTSADFTTTLDKEKIKQVAFNLIENSIKYTLSGTVTISLTREKNLIHFSVKDTGIGVSKEEQSKLFKKYSRVQEGQHSNITGTGLGLYVAKEILEEHGGDIWMESEGLDKGSTFHLTLKHGKQAALLRESESRTSFST